MIQKKVFDIEKLRRAKNSLNKKVEASLKAFDISLINLQLKYINF